MPGSLSQLIKKDHFFEAQITKKQKVTEVLKSDRRGLKYSVIKKRKKPHGLANMEDFDYYDIPIIEGSEIPESIEAVPDS